MSTTAHNGLSFKHFIPGILWFFLILVLICMPPSRVPKIEIWWVELLKPDKIIHAAMFGIQYLLFILPFGFAKTENKNHKKNIGWILISVIIWGLITELIQLRMPGRSFEWMDWFADSIGVLFVAFYIKQKEKKIPNQP